MSTYGIYHINIDKNAKICYTLKIFVQSKKQGVILCGNGFSPQF